MTIDPVIVKLRELATEPSLANDLARQFPRAWEPPVDAESVAKAEVVLGRALPPLLRDAYRVVGNGGFGPGHGLLPLLPSVEANDAESVVGLYSAFRSPDPEDPAWAWPADLVPFCDWGCAIRSCIDCASAEGVVLTFDPHARELGEDTSLALAQTHSSLRAWFSDWISGVDIWDLMFEPDPSRHRSSVNPFTKEPITLVATRLRRK